MSGRWMWLSVGLLATACSCGHDEARVAPRAERGEASSGAVAAEEAEEGAPSLPEAPAAAPPTVELRAEVDPYARVSLSISNRSAERQHLSSTLILERRSGETFEVAELGTFQLGVELSDEGCVELAPGAELRSTWSCLRAEAEGLVRDCAMAPAGDYRFVAQSCTPGGRTESASFAFVPR